MTALSLFAGHFEVLSRSGSGLVAVSPDLGRVKLARRLSTALGSDLALVTKTRPRHDVAAVAEVIGDVAGKVALIGDDMIVTGGTLAAAAEALLAEGAREVRAFATHALFADGALERLADSPLVEIVVTDTVRLPDPTPDGMTVLSVADLLARTIENVLEDRSVSAIFSGLELF